MRANWIKTLAAAVILSGTTLAFGQGQGPKPADPNQPGAKADQGVKPADKPKSKLEEMLQQALANNPDIRVAEAKVAEAEAELNRTRLTVMQKVVLYNANLGDAKAKVELAELRLKRMQNLSVQNAVSREEIDAATAELQAAKANLAKVEAELPLLLGHQGTDKSVERGLEWLRRASLDLTGDPNAWRTLENRDEAVDLGKWLAANPRIDSSRAIAFQALMAAGANPGDNVRAAQGPMAERIKKALDQEVKANYAGTPRQVLDDLLGLVKGVPCQILLAEKDLGPTPTVQLVFREPLPVGALFQAYQDSVPSSVRFVVRDYGILVTDAQHVPPGAPLLYDVWKGGKEKPKTDKPDASKKVEGKVKSVEKNGNDIAVSIGSDDGVKKGDVLHVYRLGPMNDGTGAKYLGRFEITFVDRNQSCAWRVKSGITEEIKPGDVVTNQLD